jgi:hypothetical protein
MRSQPSAHTEGHLTTAVGLGSYVRGNYQYEYYHYATARTAQLELHLL